MIKNTNEQKNESHIIKYDFKSNIEKTDNNESPFVDLNKILEETLALTASLLKAQEEWQRE